MGGSVVDGSESAGSSVGPGGDEGGGGGSGATDPGAAAATDPGGAVATDPPGAAATDGLTRVSTILTSGSAPRTRPSMRSPSTSKSAAKRREPSSWRMATLLPDTSNRSEEHTSELQSPCNLVCRLLLEKKKNRILRGIPVTLRLAA